MVFSSRLSYDIVNNRFLVVVRIPDRVQHDVYQEVYTGILPHGFKVVWALSGPIDYR